MERLEAYRADERGSGTKTALLAALAAWLFASRSDDAIVVSANQLGTDTDSIATMAGALLGTVIDREPPGPIVDLPYILREADRMWAVAQARPAGSFPYPDLLSWTPPRSASDAVGKVDGVLYVAGLTGRSGDSS